jgi:hypothetical protein
MFKLFKSKTKQGDAKVQTAQDIAYGLLMTQLDLGGALDDHAAKQRLFTAHGCGYIFGFADALFQRAGVTEEVAAMAQLTLLYVRIFGVDHGSKIFRAALDLQTENDFAAARAVGANEALKFLGDKSAPLGLTDYLNARP